MMRHRRDKDIQKKMAHTTVKHTIRKQLRKNHEFQAAMVGLWGVSIRTVERWIDNGSDKLSTPASMQLIEKHTGLKSEEILKPVKAA